MVLHRTFGVVSSLRRSSSSRYAFVPFEFEFFFSSSSFVVAFVAFVVVAVVEGTTPFGGTNSWAEGVNGICATSNNAV